MRNFFALALLFGTLCAFTAANAETVVVDFEEFANQIGENSSWNYLNDFPAGIGTKNSVPSAYGGDAEELAYQSRGVTFYNQDYLGIRVSTMTDIEFRSYLNDMASVTGTGNNGSQTYGVVFGSSTVGLEYDSLELPHISLPSGVLLDSIAITNTVYLDYLLVNTDPNGFSQPLSQEGDFMSLTIYGIDVSGTLVDSVTLDLARFEGGVLSHLDDWTTVDISSLTGAVELTFAFDGNDIGYGIWLNLPVYFAFDDLTFEVMGGDATTPEPATLLIFGAGLAGLAAMRRKRK